MSITTIYKARFESITSLYEAFGQIGRMNGLFLIRDALDISNNCHLDSIKTITLSDHSVIHIMNSECFHILNRDSEISFDWTEIYFFKDLALEEYKNTYSRLDKALIEKHTLSSYFKPQCNFWAASIDGAKLWLTSSNTPEIQSVFLNFSTQHEALKDLSFFNLICNDLLFLT